MGQFSNQIVSLWSASSATIVRRQAQEQGGLLSGVDPTAFRSDDPLRLWIIQVGIIICMSQLLSLLLAKMRQPKVIAEVLGGILLGPTAFGRIPGFTEHIFPTESIPYLSLVANMGLVLFLFLVGLEIETSVIKRNARLSASIALGGMILPFGLGAALSWPIYLQFIDQSVKFTHFMLFAGVAFSITAFPVLCRILTELKLVDTTVGIVVLSAGVGNDIIGWILLALSVALVNAASGLSAVWILLAAVGWTIFLLFPVKRLVLWLAHRTGAIENGPSIFFMTVIILIVFGSAFFTDAVGIHAIFGGFLAGLIVPREGGMTITLTEKLEDMVSIIFLPLYFTLSGLSTDLGLLNNGITWAYTVAICVTAYTGKFGGCTTAARLSGFKWREAATIGTLMSCKGLVELIVLNVGLNAHILSQRVFSMFVLEALLLTFMTTPVVTILYPPSVRSRAAPEGEFAGVPGNEDGTFDKTDPTARRSRSKAGSVVGAGGSPGGDTGGAHSGSGGVGGVDGSGGDGGELDEKKKKGGLEEWERKTHFTVVLDKIEHLPGMMTLAQLIQPPPPAYEDEEQQPGRYGYRFGSTSGRVGQMQMQMQVPMREEEEVQEEVEAVATESNDNALGLQMGEGGVERQEAEQPIVAQSSQEEESSPASQARPLSPPNLPTPPALQAPVYSRHQQSARPYGSRQVSYAVPPTLPPAPPPARSDLVIDALRLIELSDRTSAVMKSSAAESLIHTDPLLGVFKTFGELHGMPMTSNLSVVTYDDLAGRVADHAREMGSHMVLVPWLPPHVHVHHGHETPSGGQQSTYNPFDALFRTTVETSPSAVHSHFIRGVFSHCATDVALFVDRRRTDTSTTTRSGKQHLFVPFFGGPDDRLALDFVVQLCANPKISATVVRFVKSDPPEGGLGVGIGGIGGVPTDGGLGLAGEDVEKPSAVHLNDVTQASYDHQNSALANIRDHGFTIHSVNLPDTMYGQATTQTRLLSETADNIIWQRYTTPPSDDPLSPQITSALTRIEFTQFTSPKPLHAVIFHMGVQQEYAASQGKRLMIVCGRSRRMAPESHHRELKEVMEMHGKMDGDVKKTVGDVATALVVSGCDNGLIVMQAAQE